MFSPYFLSYAIEYLFQNIYISIFYIPFKKAVYSKIQIKMPLLLTPGEQFEQSIHDDAPDRFSDIYVKFRVCFEDPEHEYTVMIELYDCDTGEQLRWVEPGPKIRVKHFADRVIQTEFDAQVEFENNKFLAVFDHDLDDRGWSEYLLIVMEIEGGTVNYAYDSHMLLVEEKRVVTLLSYKTFAAGARQIWGTVYTGRGKSLAIEGGHSLES